MKLIRKTGLSLLSILACLILLETALWGYHAAINFFRTPPLHIAVESPFLYGLNPEHPEINAQGLRDDEVPISKPNGTFRILVLGDSVPYGHHVAMDRTFPNQLESLLRQQGQTTEVINSGVQGYTAYNEIQYYLTQGKAFESDLVLVAFCMNDVVNPRLHWGYTQEEIVNIPKQAIPNQAYDRDHALPKMQELREEKERTNGQSLLEYSKLYKAIKSRLAPPPRPEAVDLSHFMAEKPTFLTSEDTLSIEVLLDETSPEWRWLTSIYSRLHEAVQEDQAKLVLVLLPLAYQLNEGYPFFPQTQLTEYCRRESIPCLDLLPAFRQHPKEKTFLLNQAKAYDVWHLTDFGHELCAERILAFLQKEKLLLSPDG